MLKDGRQDLHQIWLNPALICRCYVFVCRKLHLLENPQLVNPDCRDKHYFAKAILTRTSDSPGTTSTSLAIDSASDPKGETECDLSG